jgi:putative addiction module killer protein
VVLFSSFISDCALEIDNVVVYKLHYSNMDVAPKILKIYQTASGALPFLEWLHSLRDGRTRAIIMARLARVRLGNMGNTSPVGEGVQELKINYGPGYRVYFGQDGTELVILLTGGDKSTQDEDIETAKGYWQAYKKEYRSADY